MKIGTLLGVTLFAILLGINLLIVEPFFETNRWAAYGASFALFFLLSFVLGKLEDRFEFLSREVDGQMSAWYIAALLFMPFFFSMIAQQ